jgi:ADP-heptose:LPS heptosyltransferase
LDLFISAVAKADARQIIVPYIQPPPGGGRKKTKHLRWRRTPQISGGNVKLFATQTPFDLIALIHKSDLLISPDTAAVHIAAAWRKKTIAFYNHPQVPVWLPNNPAAAIIKTAPEDINKFDFKEFERVYKQML